MIFHNIPNVIQSEKNIKNGKRNSKKKLNKLLLQKNAQMKKTLKQECRVYPKRRLQTKEMPTYLILWIKSLRSYHLSNVIHPKFFLNFCKLSSRH